MNATSFQKPPIPSLTSSRFLPALHVMAYHMVMGYERFGQQVMQENPAFSQWCADGVAVFDRHWVAHNLLKSGVVTVSFFFTLSGFILVYNHLDERQVMQVDRRDFFVARFARIYPAYLLGLFFSLPLLLVAMQTQDSPITVSNGWTALSALFLLQSWWPGSALVWNPPCWSLSCELFFYAIFPWLALALNGMHRRHLYAGMALCVVISLGTSLTYVAFDPDVVGNVQWTTDGWWLYFVKHHPLVRLPEFLFGMFLGKLHGLRTVTDLETERRRGARMSLGATAAIAAVCLASSRIPYVVMHNGLITVLFGFLIYGLALGGGWLSAVLSWPRMVLFGDATYALYILHVPLIAYAMVAAASAKERLMSAFSYLIVCEVMAVWTSVFVFQRYETPIRRWIRRRWGRARA